MTAELLVEFEWDEIKRAEVYKKHGVDLLEAALIFENTYWRRKTRAGIMANSA